VIRLPNAFRPRMPGLPATLLLLLAALSLAAAPGHAQRRPRQQGNSVLLVTVLDEHGQPIPQAHVTVGGMEFGELTDARGTARISRIPEGGRLIVVSRQGYEYSRTGAEFAVNDTIRREVRLTSAPIELEGIVATSWGRSMYLRRNGFYSRQRRGFGAFITSERIDELRPLRTLDLFRSMRGFMVSHDRTGHEMVISGRGGGIHGTCLPSVWLDGMMMFTRDALDQEMSINMVPPGDIEGMEAISGASSVPAEFNITGHECGVILIWTKRG
jgi:hypothetical protein